MVLYYEVNVVLLQKQFMEFCRELFFSFVWETFKRFIDINVFVFVLIIGFNNKNI